ncbi:hypothetical protein, partial [Salmonella enterica]|uniref:hypothetical protein n=1 Tax=Salmonella enterica TaxID=28901 RepID=UPI0020C32D28
RKGIIQNKKKHNDYKNNPTNTNPTHKNKNKKENKKNHNKTAESPLRSTHIALSLKARYPEDVTPDSDDQK